MRSDYEALANQGMPPDKLASRFFREYFQDSEITFPINPFQMLTDLGIPFLLRSFQRCEGIYIPPADEDDIPIVGINLDRPITRQRFSAAHELCHYLKDSNKQFTCILGSGNEIEKYAERFAAELLMPMEELRKQVALYEKNGYIDLDSVLLVADYFGVSFQSCLFQIAYKLHKIKGDTDPAALKKAANQYKPETKRKEKGLVNTLLYAQLMDALTETFRFEPTPHTLLKFKTNYIFQDSRMEGVQVDQETASQIVVDLGLHQQESVYCKEGNQNLIEVAGLSFAYDYAFEECKSLITIYDAKHINEKLYSTAPYPEFGGTYRRSNTLVTGAKFDALDYHLIPQEMKNLDQQVKMLTDECDALRVSEYIKKVAEIHHRLTVIHAFQDGNGRTARVFANMLLMRRDISPIFFSDNQKESYKDALKTADTTGSWHPLYECFFKSILHSFAALSDFQI